jgi:hypothetical protein
MTLFRKNVLAKIAKSPIIKDRGSLIFIGSKLLLNRKANFAEHTPKWIILKFV